MRKDLLRFLVCGATALAAFITILDAQITVPFPTFTAGTVIQPSEVNSNFAKFSDALNRTGGTMTGTLTSQQITPSATATYDLGVTGTRFRDLWLSRDATVGGALAVTGAVSGAAGTFTTGTFTGNLLAGTTATYDLGVTGTRWRDAWFSGNVTAGGVGAFDTLTTAGTGAASIDVAGGITAGTGNVGIVDATGKIPALSSTYLASLSGANLTGLAEANITDGSLLARLAANETVTGNWTFSPSGGSTTLTVGSPSAGTNLVLNGRSSDDLSQIGFFANNGSTRTGLIHSDPTNGVRLYAGTTPTLALTLTTSGAVAVGTGTAIASVLTGTTTWDPASAFNNTSQTTTVTVTGVQTTSPCFVGFRPLVGGSESSGWVFSASYSAANTVRVVGVNATGSTIDLDSGTVRVTCFTY